MGDIDHLTELGIPSRGGDEDEEREMESRNSSPPDAVFLNVRFLNVCFHHSLSFRASLLTPCSF
jgi:hypothetical protein